MDLIIGKRPVCGLHHQSKMKRVAIKTRFTERESIRIMNKISLESLVVTVQVNTSKLRADVQSTRRVVQRVEDAEED